MRVACLWNVVYGTGCYSLIAGAGVWQGAAVMRYLELRRHAMRTQPGQHLSQAGVRLSRRVGEGRGPFALVVTSPAPRAFETAIAMGFAVDFQHHELDSPDIDVFADLAWSSGF